MRIYVCYQSVRAARVTMVGALSRFPLAAATSGNRLSSILPRYYISAKKTSSAGHYFACGPFTNLHDHKCHNFAISQRWSYKAEHLSSPLDGNWLRRKLTRDACALPALRPFRTVHFIRCVYYVSHYIYQSQQQYPGLYTAAHVLFLLKFLYRYTDIKLLSYRLK